VQIEGYFFFTKQYTICFFIVIFFDLLVPTSKWGWGFSMTSNPGMSHPQILSSAISHPVDISGERDILSQHHPFFAKYVKTQLLQCIYTKNAKMERFLLILGA
jgi:hypothetical protein